MTTSPPALRGVVLRVPDPAACRSFYEHVLGSPVRPGPLPGWLTVDVGWGQSLWLAPGGRTLPVLTDRWQRQGVIPIVRTHDLAGVVAAADETGATWVNRVFRYQMMGTGDLGYLHDPARQTVGIQARGDDSVRGEDLAAGRRRALEPDGRAAGLGWLILQAADIVAAREFYAGVVGWPMHRGTDGFGYMHGIDDVTTLQIAFRGRLEDPARDLAAEPTLPVLRADAALVDVVAGSGGAAADSPIPGTLALTDPQGTAWIVDPDAVLDGSAEG